MQVKRLSSHEMDALCKLALPRQLDRENTGWVFAAWALAAWSEYRQVLLTTHSHNQAPTHNIQLQEQVPSTYVRWL